MTGTSLSTVPEPLAATSGAATGPATASGGALVSEAGAATAVGGGSGASAGGRRSGERVHRPWGWYETLAGAAAATADGCVSGYLVKRLWIHPHSRISLQRHQLRCEHWVVVAGSGELLCGEQLQPARPGTCLDVPLGALHRASAGAEGLLIIEVQRGETLREDDIERFADDYGRVIRSGINL